MPLSPDLFKRLSRLNRQRLAADVTTGDQVGTDAGSPSPAPHPPAGPLPASLEEVVPGTVRQAGPGRYYHVSRAAADLLRRGAEAADADGFAAPDLLAAYERAFFGAGCRVTPEDLHEGVRPLLESDVRGLAYLDIESCGLVNETIFLVGLLRWRDGALRLDQYLARDYAEEGPMLAAVWNELASAACLVTYNGKSFDWPAMTSRTLVCGAGDPPEVPWHVDLLHEARRRWRGDLPNCRLQTLEQCLFGRRRVGDIPGHAIPEAYHAFVGACQGDDAALRGACFRKIQTILHHNALDLLTLAELGVHILSGHGATDG